MWSQSAGFGGAHSGGWAYRRSLAALLVITVALLAGCASRQPVHELEVRGHVKSLASSGTALAVRFVDGKTCVWDWADLARPARSYTPRSVNAALLGPKTLIDERPADPQRPQPAVIAREQPGDRVSRTWPLSADWYCSDFSSSPNGRNVAILLEESKPTGGDTCLGVVAPTTKEIFWVPAKGRVVKVAEEGMAISNNGRYVALLGLGDIRKLTVADMTARKLLWQRAVPQARSVAFSPDGSVLYVGGHTGIHAMQSATGQLLSTWSADPSRALGAPVARVAASPDGRFLAAGTDLPDGRACLLDARTGQVVMAWPVTNNTDGGSKGLSLRARKTTIDGLAFSPSGKYLATADSLSQSVRIWQTPQPTPAKARFAWLRRK